MKRLNYSNLEIKIRDRHQELQSLEKAKQQEKEFGFIPYKVNSKTIILAKAHKQS